MCYIHALLSCRIPLQVKKMNSRIVALLTLFALAPLALGRHLDFWQLFDEPGK